nr:hypothetical protein [Propionibacterium sp.]
MGIEESLNEAVAKAKEALAGLTGNQDVGNFLDDIVEKAKEFGAQVGHAAGEAAEKAKEFA